MSPVYRIGVDLGGTKIETILLDQTGNALFRHRIATERQKGYDAIVAKIVQQIRRAQDHIPDGNAPFSVGCGIPGYLDPETGLVRNANTTCLIGKPLARDISKAIHQPVVLENDANCFVLAEVKQGAAVGHPLVFGIIMGTGCGGGLWMIDRVWSGQHLIAGEWGHASNDPNGAPCYCGKTGCIETQLSGTGVEEAHHRTYGKHLDMKTIVAGYRNGEPTCTATFKTFLHNFGRALGGLISILDPSAVVLGGGLSDIRELYTLGLEQVRHHAFHPNLKTPILKNKLGDAAGVYGAAWIGAQPTRNTLEPNP